MKLMTWVLLSFFLFTAGCSYETTYRDYALAQGKVAMMSGPLIELYEDGKIKSIGNPMVALVGLQMKPPKDAWEYLFDFLKTVGPFGVMWGIVGSMASGIHGNQTNVSGQGNYTGNTSGNQTQMGSPTTTTTTSISEESVRINK
jgi:hypothetical protein